MPTYTSSKAVPYVYICTNKQTRQFYIGYRQINLIPSDQDLPKYKTSSKQVKKLFDQFEWVIFAEFQTGNDAYDFEQQLIYENWDDPLLLNKQYRLATGEKRFKSQKGKIVTDKARRNMSAAQKGKSRGSHSDEHNAKIGLSNTGKIYSTESRINYSKGQKARYEKSSDSELTRRKKSDAHKGQYRIESPDGRIWITNLGLKEFAVLNKDEINISPDQLFYAYRKCYNNKNTVRKRKDNNQWQVIRLDNDDDNS